MYICIFFLGWLVYLYIIGRFDFCQVLTAAGGFRLPTNEVCVELLRFPALSLLPLFLCLVFVLVVFLISCVFFNSMAISPPTPYLRLALLTPQFCFHHCLCCLSEASWLRGASMPWLRKPPHICCLPSWEQPAVYSKLHASILFPSGGILASCKKRR